MPSTERQAAPPPDDLAALAPDEAAALVAERKAEADRHWMINPNRSLELAEQIIAIGAVRNEPQHIALGLMARGDALKLLGRTAEAWAALGEAGERFRAIDDEVGWARTRIGRLLVCVDLQRVAEAQADAATARAIFTAAGVLDKRLVLDINLAIVQHLLGAYDEALRLYQAALETAEAIPAIGAPWLGSLQINLGYLYDLKGDFDRALDHYARGRRHCVARGEVGSVAIIDLNSAHIAMAQGHYREALRLLHSVHAFYTAEGLALDATRVDADRVECYLLLNRYAEARDLARRVCNAFQAAEAGYWAALARLNLATGEASLGNYAAALEALAAAEASFAALGSATWGATIRLRRSKIALLQDDPATAAREASAAAAAFAASGRQVDHAEARLLWADAMRRSGQAAAAVEACAAALATARRCHVPPLYYAAHLQSGHVAAALGRPDRARRAYQAAVATVIRAQQGLTVQLRPGFLEDKLEAFHALMGIELQRGAHRRAFELLEQARSQNLLAYLANRDQLRHPDSTPEARALRAELNRLRADHHALYARVHGPIGDPDAPQAARDPAESHARLAATEQRMRALAEQLALLSDDGPAALPPAPSLAAVQQRLAPDERLLAFYSDGARLWAFQLSSADLAVIPLAFTPARLAAVLDRLQLNLRAALHIGPEAPLSQRLAASAQHLLGELHRTLLAPLATTLASASRLLIVPYGLLHAVPFHLLHDGQRHLIERHELSVLPAASLLARPPVRRPRGALVLAHTQGGALPFAEAEARAVHARFGGRLHLGEAAVRATLGTPAAQILHIAAHGEQRLDQPDLSFLALADGQLYADDLLERNLSYELVTLSACETGRSVVAAGDEPIGLGRGILYAGAAALIASLWRVADQTTAKLMATLYAELDAGATKSAALRTAQLALRAADPALHPAFWGAFQLVGDPRPLTQPVSAVL